MGILEKMKPNICFRGLTLFITQSVRGGGNIWRPYLVIVHRYLSDKIMTDDTAFKLLKLMFNWYFTFANTTLEMNTPRIYSGCFKE